LGLGWRRSGTSDSSASCPFACCRSIRSLWHCGGHIDLVGGRLEGAVLTRSTRRGPITLRLAQGACLRGGISGSNLANTPEFATAFCDLHDGGQADFKRHSFAGTATGSAYDVAPGRDPKWPVCAALGIRGSVSKRRYLCSALKPRNCMKETIMPP